ncbi:unnamed protein product, partial [Phaeothamnion confervicola]
MQQRGPPPPMAERHASTAASRQVHWEEGSNLAASATSSASLPLAALAAAAAVVEQMPEGDAVFSTSPATTAAPGRARSGSRKSNRKAQSMLLHAPLPPPKLSPTPPKLSPPPPTQPPAQIVQPLHPESAAGSVRDSSSSSSSSIGGGDNGSGDSEGSGGSGRDERPERRGDKSKAVQSQLAGFSAAAVKTAAKTAREEQGPQFRPARAVLVRTSSRGVGGDGASPDGFQQATTKIGTAPVAFAAATAAAAAAAAAVAAVTDSEQANFGLPPSYEPD